MDALLFYFIYTFCAVVALALFVGELRHILHKHFKESFAAEKVMLLITVPKEGAETDDEKQKDLKQKIAVMETFFTGVHATRSRDPLVNYFYGRDDEVAFEIVAHQGVIKFYAVVPRSKQQYIEQQLQAQFPSAQLEEVDDYNIFLPNGVIMSQALSTGSAPFLPLRTYQHMDSDPLDALTNVMSKVGEGEGMALQILLRPADYAWGEKAQKMATEMQQGKSAKSALKKLNAGVVSKAFNGAWSLLSVGTKKKDAMTPDKPMYHLTPAEDELIKQLQGKSGKAGYEVNIRSIASSATRDRAQLMLDSMVQAFSQYDSLESPARFKKGGSGNHVVKKFIYRTFDAKHRMLLSVEEVSSIFHLPLPTTETPNIFWMVAKKAAAPVNIPKDGLLLGYNVYRGITTEIRMKDEDRRRHMYIIGKSGVGKSVLQANCIIQDIKNGKGVAVIDPHGELVEDILPHIPKERIEDVVLFDPSDAERPMGLNMLEFKSEEQKDFAVQELVAIFYKLFGQEMIGPMFEHYMRNAMLALMSDSENMGTVVEIPRMFTDKDFRASKIKRLNNVVVKNFWEQEYEQSQRGQQSADMLSYVISKIGRFLTNDIMRNIVGQQKSGFDFREIMDNQKILLVNLSKGKIGEVNSSLLGLIIVSKLQMAALSRASVASSERKDFYLYIDEFQNFITDSIATILSEARKYKLNLIIAHQYVSQLVNNNDTKIRDAVFGNAGTIMSFRVGVEDAEVLAKEFAPVFGEFDVINIEKFTAYVKLLIDNTASRPFNMHTFPPQPNGNPKIAEIVKQYSRLKYGRDRRIVEAEIRERSQLDKLGSRPQVPLEPSL